MLDFASDSELDGRHSEGFRGRERGVAEISIVVEHLANYIHEHISERLVLLVSKFYLCSKDQAEMR